MTYEAHFFFRKSEYSVDPKNIYQKKEKWKKKFMVFLDNLIWIGNGKFSLLLPEYSYLEVKVLTSSPKISDLIKNSFF